MKKVVLLLLLFMCVGLVFAGTYSGGSGTLALPYRISTTADLIELSNNSADWSKYFIQTTDLSFDASASNVDWDGDGSASWDANDQLGFSPIGNSSTKFTGEYDGQDYSINYLYIDRPSTNYVGLWGYVDGADLKNLGLIDATVEGHQHVGILAGFVENISTVYNCYSTGSLISNSGIAGGLIGNLVNTGSNTVNLCYSEANVLKQTTTYGGKVGGLIGRTYQTVVYDQVINSYSTGNVESSCSEVGGLIGNFSKGNVKNCYSTGAVTYTHEDGVTNAYAGGLIGNSSGDIYNSFSNGEVTSAISTKTGGLIGSLYLATAYNCYWDTETSLQSTSAGGVGKTSDDMKGITANNDLADDWGWDESIWQRAGNTYPDLIDNSRFRYSGGGGTLADPYRIAKTNDLIELSITPTDWDKYFLQTADISFDASESNVDWDGDGSADWDAGDQLGFSPIGNTSTKFSGSYDGNDKTITNLFIDRGSEENIGFFGFLNSASLSDLTLSSIDITGQNHVGGLAGQDEGNTVISTCNINESSTVDGNSYVGGFIGESNSSGTMTHCHFSGTITANNLNNSISAGGFIGEKSGSGSVLESSTSGTINGNGRNHGGFVGWMDNGQIRKCYSTMIISNTSTTQGRIGGFVGGHAYFSSNSGQIYDCYARGNVSADLTTNLLSYGIGGFVGSYYAADNHRIYNSYSPGAISAANASLYVGGFSGEDYNGDGGANDCFWDMTSSGQASSAESGSGETGLETYLMKTSSTFTSAGWDFTGESSNGNDDIWTINASYNDGYPYLNDNPSSDIATPITLVSFTANVKAASVELNWKTASETNNAAFLVYRNDEIIARIEGAGTTSETHTYSYVDASLIPDLTYTYVLADVDYANNETKYEAKAVTVTLANDVIEADFKIGAAYPNPFNPTAVVPVELARDAVVSAKIFTLTGRLIATLVNGTMNAGSHELRINANNMTTGLYLVKVMIEDVVHVQKIAFVK